MAIHHTLQLLTTTYHNKPTHVFIDCLNVMYLLNTQIKHPTIHNSHLNKLILESIVEMLKPCTQIITIHKVKAHANIDGNEQADALAKLKHTKYRQNATTPYGRAHSTPYNLQRNPWHSMKKTLDNGPIKHLEKHNTYDKRHKLIGIANPTHQLYKWLENMNIDKVLSNDFGKNPTIIDK